MHNMLPLKKVPQERQTGFTLVEALIAMLILVVAIVGWMGAGCIGVQPRPQPDHDCGHGTGPVQD